eukprot:CAMPEP_0205917744 /NCGR_PEP_ID=MMETSP1325-20131115/9360_1 /ASSEMBLY_ACC=CAM_ASM_000708 /TAXON_ID=236786 /ORGANISM="Florenciella sp., Strain RCC1007" /LENGTH=30 /DNA_ID= /DNA_START= /DNA_END= /DNA_ORIENTATION=
MTSGHKGSSKLHSRTNPQRHQIPEHEHNQP